MRKSLTILFALVLVISVAGVASAQTESITDKTHTSASSTVEVRNALVLDAYPNHVVLLNQDGNVIDFLVPSGLTFNIDGHTLKARELQPGTKLTAKVQTTTTSKKIVTTTIRTGEVLHVQGKTAFVRAVDGVKKVVPPADFAFMVNGKPTTISGLGKGMNFTATLDSESIPEVSSERSLVSEIRGTAPARSAAAAKPAPVAKVATTRLAQLPSTASQLPLIGLIGLLSLLMGAALTLTRRLG